MKEGGIKNVWLVTTTSDFISGCRQDKKPKFVKYVTYAISHLPYTVRHM